MRPHILLLMVLPMVLLALLVIMTRAQLQHAPHKPEPGRRTMLGVPTGAAITHKDWHEYLQHTALQAVRMRADTLGLSQGRSRRSGGMGSRAAQPRPAPRSHVARALARAAAPLHSCWRLFAFFRRDDVWCL